MDTLTATVRQQGRASGLVLRRRDVHLEGHRGRERAAFFCSRTSSTQGKVTPLHLHPNADETFYLLEGEVLLHVDGEETTLGAGGHRDVPAPRAARLHGHVTDRQDAGLPDPGCGEAFYRHASEAAPPAASDFGRVRAAAEATGAIEVLGPPPF